MIPHPTTGNPAVPFHKAGRDYHLPHIEVAVLGIVLRGPALIPKVVHQLDVGDFFNPHANGLFGAMLFLYNRNQAVDEQSLTAHFWAVEPKFAPDWINFINNCMSCSFNAKDLDRYILKLKDAAAIRAGQDYCPQKYSEGFCAQLFTARHSDVCCVENKWRRFEKGVWTAADINMLRPKALEVIHPAHQTSRRATDLLLHVEHFKQVPASRFSGAIKRDGDRILINAADCVIEVARDGTRRRLDHSPSFYFTERLETAFNPEERATTFLRVLEEALPDIADRNVFQAFAGYIFLPGCELETALVAYGPGGTGKSTLAGAIGEVLGQHLLCSAGLDELCKSGSYTLPTLKHRLLNLGSELEGEEVQQSANFKKLVSGEFLNVRQIYAQPEEMKTICKLMFLTNLQPRFRSGTDAEARRLRIIPFTVKPKEKDPSLKQKLKEEAAGVLNWMLDGLAEVMRTNKIPDGGAAAKAAHDRFSRHNDPVGSFIKERCVFKADRVTPKKDLFMSFAEWCEDEGLSAEKWENYFFKTLHQRHPELKTMRRLINKVRTHCYLGIYATPGFTEEFEDTEDESETAARRSAIVPSESLRERLRSLAKESRGGRI